MWRACGDVAVGVTVDVGPSIAVTMCASVFVMANSSCEYQNAALLTVCVRPNTRTGRELAITAPSLQIQNVARSSA